MREEKLKNNWGQKHNQGKRGVAKKTGKEWSKDFEKKQDGEIFLETKTK